MDLQGRLPPMQQVVWNTTIGISIGLVIVALGVVIYLAYRSRIKAKGDARKEALALVEKILLKRGGNIDDADRMLAVLNDHPELDPSAMLMIKEKFHDELRPILERTYDQQFGERMERIYFPPPKDTRRALATQSQDATAAVEEVKSSSNRLSTATAAILDLMDATLKPGTMVRLTFQGLDGGYECLVMGHDMQSINLTLPAHNDQLVASLRPGMRVEGMLESGPSLMAFTSVVIQAVAGSMPYCRIGAWSSAWEVRKRDSVRLPISLEIDFQHISTASSDSIKMSNLEKEIGTIRPGRLMDISLGGCGIETPSSAVFNIGDMIRFSKSLIDGTAPVSLLGAVVMVDSIDPMQNEGSHQRLHVQFLIIDDVSQRILVRTLRQLQDVQDRDEWMLAQQLLQKMRRNKIQNIGSPSASPRKATTRGGRRSATTSVGSRTGTKPGSRGSRPSTRSIARTPGQRPPGQPPTRALPPTSGRNDQAAPKPDASRPPPPPRHNNKQ